MLKAVLFDWYGTLVNSLVNIEKTYRKVEKELRLGYPYEKFRLLIGIPTSEQAKLVMPEDPDYYIEYYRKAYASNDPDPAYPGAGEALAALKAMGLAVGLVTSKTRASLTASAMALGLLQYFDLTVCGDHVARPKPDPLPVETALKKMGLRPEEAVYAGDSVQDLLCARGAGVKVISVTWGARRRDELAAEKPEFLADSWDDLIAAVKALAEQP